MRHVALATALVAILLAAAGCGSSKNAANAPTTVTVTTPAPATTPATTPTTAPQTTPVTTPGSPPSAPPVTATQPAPPPAPPGGTLAAAEAVVRAKGFDVSDPSDYVPDHLLRVLIGVRHGSADARAQRAFFFVGPRYIGTDTSDDSAAIRVEDQGNKLITLAYALYRPNDPLCCPSAGQARVRYQWDGTRLRPLDPIPPSSPNANPNRG